MSILLVVQAGHGTAGVEHQLAPFAGSTVFDVALGRLSGFTHGPTIVAISDLPSDEPFAELARNRGAAVVRGPSDDMLARFVEVIADYPAEHLARVTLQSPFIDHALVTQVVDAHLASGADYTSNSLLRTHPAGLEVEVIRSDALLDAAEQATSESERNGVTTFVYRRPAEYNLHTAAAAGDYEDHQWKATTPDSIDRLEQLLEAAGGDLSRSWEHFLAYDRPGLGRQKLRLRVARQNVLDALPDLTDALGYPPDPFPSGDPARRSWGVWFEEELIGAVAVSVQNGWGTLAGNFMPNLDDALADMVVDAIDERLSLDDQVMALTIDGSRIREYRA